MAEDDLKLRLIAALPRDLLIDLMDATVARAAQAYEIIRDHTDLKGKSARGAEGQVRFRLIEKGFQEVCELHGAMPLAEGVLPGTELRFYQPFMRFDCDKGGVILGFASMPTRRELPIKNQSRSTGVTLNFHLTPHLALDPSDPQPGDIFVLFLMARDPAGVGKIDEIAIGIVASNYESFVFYETVESFIANYIVEPTATVNLPVPAVGMQDKLVKLKAAPKLFKPPEVPSGTDEESSDEIA